MTYFQKKEENYAKWQGDIWNSVQKQISLFNKKVTDCMHYLGDISKKKEKDFQIEPCLEGEVILGEEFYVELIRPVCVAKGYLPKKPPTPEDVEDIRFIEEQQRKAVNIQNQQVEKSQKDKAIKNEKKTNKKGSKNPNNQEQMKLKIVKDNFQKDIQLVMKSHSNQRMQVEFGLKHKKLQVKLMTFFYVAYYIRKNKVIQKIDDSEIFQLINILIKIVRIFSHFRGKSFADNSKEVEVSSTLILDLKNCIKGLKEYYKYDNKVVMIKYPKLIYYTYYDRFFPTLDIKPYDSQIKFIQAIKSALNEKGSIQYPTLVLYKTMIGSGKTSASIALAELVNQCKLVDQKNSKMQVLYSCLIGSVRVQVGRYAYNKKQKFALAAMQKSIKDETYYYPRVINSWSCRYEKIVDLIISDLYCAYQMLDHHYYTPEELDILNTERKLRKNIVNVGMLDRQNLILFVDQPTAFCKDTESKATTKLFDLLANYPPKLIVLASATMPDQIQLTKTIQLIKRKNPKLQVIQVQSQQFQIGCQYCSYKGEIIFPHTGVKSKQELQKIRDLLKRNPFLLRLYTGPSLFHLIRKCHEVGLKNLPNVNNLPEIRQKDIIRSTERILEILSKQSDELIEQVCKLSREEDNIDYKEQIKEEGSDDQIDFTEQNKDSQDEEVVEKADYVDFFKIHKQDAYKFLGGCLIGTADPLKFAQQVFQKWVKNIKPVKRLIQKYEKEVQALSKQIKLLQDDQEMRQQKKTQEISKLQSDKQPVLDFPQKKKINTVEHYTRYCNKKETIHQSMLIKPVPLENVGKDLIQQVDDFVLKLLFCGVAVYSETGLSGKYLDKVEELASQNFLAYIITDQSLCYGANFPISNVILRDSLAVKLNMNQMFQLIGRAGRVGQSWTARAFLGAKGLEKLNNYIHKPQCQISNQGSVFQKLACEHLNYPLFRLRSTISQIRYLDNRQSQQIEILIKKKNLEDSHLFKKVLLICYIKNEKSLKVLSNRMPFSKVNKYLFPTQSISYDDLPKILNQHQEEIIDVESYYVNQEKYISKILENTLTRIIEEKIDGKVKIDGNSFKQINYFKPKVYEDFFNKSTNTFAVLIECQSEFQFKEYKFNELIPSQLELDQIFQDKIKILIDESIKLVPTIIDHPSSICENDVKKLVGIHSDFKALSKLSFYQQFFSYYFKQEQKHYSRIIEKVPDKEMLGCKQGSIIILTISRIRDLINCPHKLFHIDQNIREIWQGVEKKI